MASPAVSTLEAFKRSAIVHSISDSPAFAERLAETYESLEESPRLMKGFFVALALQGVALFAAVAVWDVWRMVR